MRCAFSVYAGVSCVANRRMNNFADTFLSSCRHSRHPFRPFSSSQSRTNLSHTLEIPIAAHAPLSLRKPIYSLYRLTCLHGRNCITQLPGLTQIEAKNRIECVLIAEKVGARTHSLANKKKCCNSGVYAFGHAECGARASDRPPPSSTVSVNFGLFWFHRDRIVISQSQARMIRWIAELLWFLKGVVMEWNYLTRDRLATIWSKQETRKKRSRNMRRFYCIMKYIIPNDASHSASAESASACECVLCGRKSKIDLRGRPL